MERLTSVIITSIAAASGSMTQPRRSACSPNVNQVKLWKTRYPGVCNVGRNAATDIVDAMTWPKIASAAAALFREFARPRIASEAASGTAGISQRLVTIQELIL